MPEEQVAEQLSEYEIRKQSVESLRQQGIDPYPSSGKRTKTAQAFLEDFESIDALQSIEMLVGRVRLQREHGKLSFFQLQDESGKIQLVLTENDLRDRYAEALDQIDVGDFIEVSGKAFRTKKGEASVLVSSFRLLTKAIRPLPDKWHGIQDEEERYRRRYLDILMNDNLKEMFYMKSRFWRSIREFLQNEGFLEVETPVLESTPGGADAEPFITHHNALDIDLFLRISMGELWQKRLMVAGFEKTFEIGRQFRNEGMSPEHLQDYTQMEFYWAYADYRMGMELTERMYKQVIQETFGTMQFSIRGFTLNFDTQWGEIDYVEEIERQLHIHVDAAEMKDLIAKCEELGIVKEDALTRPRLIDSLWKHCRKKIAGPVFLVNHPIAVSPLAKKHADNPSTVQRFQIIIAGSELGNGYSELNDPVDQAERFEAQAVLRESGDAEAQMHDADFVEALEYGMPPTCGFGLSERVFSFLMDKPIKEAVLFPLLRPKNTNANRGVDTTLEDFDAGITREEAQKWLFEQMQDENLRRHSLSTEALMRALAAHFKAKSVDAWGIAGLLHDIDWEHCDIAEHSLRGAEMLTERGIHSDIVDAVREHNAHHEIEPQTILSKSLYCLEQLTGLILAVTYVRPDKKLASVKVSSVKKKFKDKSFARGVVREEIVRSEELLGLTLDESIELCLQAMQNIASELGLE